MRKFRLFGIMGIHRIKKMLYIFFRNSIWKIGWEEKRGGETEEVENELIEYGRGIYK